MEKDFDFEAIGKRTPYRTPDGFFDNMQRKVLKHVGVEQKVKTHHTRLIALTTAAVAAIVAGLAFVPSMLSPTSGTIETEELVNVDSYAYNNDPLDKWIIELSDEELEELVSFSENDIFLY